MANLQITYEFALSLSFKIFVSIMHVKYDKNDSNFSIILINNIIFLQYVITLILILPFFLFGFLSLILIYFFYLIIFNQIVLKYIIYK